MATSRGILVIVSSPSGAGKTTLTRRLLTEFDTIGFSVSYTTRPIRTGEVDGRDYHFVSPDTFEAMRERGEFAEYAIVHGNRYGTARGPVEHALASGRDMIFDVDWQGGHALSQQWPTDILKIFILPPTLDALAERLRRRATDTPDVIDRRLRKAIEELNHFHEYQHLIVNDDVDSAYQVLRGVYVTRRYGRVNQPEVAIDLEAAARVVDANRLRAVEDHARALIASR